MSIKITELRNWYFIVLLICSCIRVDAVTLVYNMQLRRFFEQMTAADRHYHWLLSAIPLVYIRTRTIDDPRFNIFAREKRLAVGPLLNARYVASKYWWYEITTAFEKEYGKSKGTVNFSRSNFGMDDIVLTAARAFYPIKNMQYVVYGMAGFPIRQKINLFDAQDPFIGTRFYSLGIGSELSYSVKNSTQKSALMWLFQNRFIHFFQRSWFPILPQGSKIKPGDLIDLLVAVHYRKKLNSFEIGFDQTFFINAALILPDRVIKNKNFARQVVYANASHIVKNFPLLDTPVVLGAGFVVGYSGRFKTRLCIGSLNFTVVF